MRSTRWRFHSVSCPQMRTQKIFQSSSSMLGLTIWGCSMKIKQQELSYITEPELIAINSFRLLTIKDQRSIQNFTKSFHTHGSFQNTSLLRDITTFNALTFTNWDRNLKLVRWRKILYSLSNTKSISAFSNGSKCWEECPRSCWKTRRNRSGMWDHWPGEYIPT